MIAAAMAIALVVQDPVPLRAAANETAPRQATLWQGDWLEVRGERQGFVQVYDHRRERSGYVRDTQVRRYPLDASSAPTLRTLMEFFRDSPGSEALGIGYLAALLRVAPPADITVDVFDALGTMADRLARRASVQDPSKGAVIAGHLEVAQSYGVKLLSVEREGRTRVCYDGEAFRRVLALGGTPAQRARAALALTDDECVDPSAAPAARQTMNEWRRDVLESVETSGLPAYVANRLQLRRASVEATLAFELSRRGDPTGAARAAEASVKALARIERAELAEEDRSAYSDAAIRVGASRWAAENEPSKNVIQVVATEDGQTCIRLEDTSPAAGAFERCTYGHVWAASARRAAPGNGVAVAVQMSESWTELWIIHREKNGWQADVLSPATADPELGYVELAGWSPDGRRAVLVREARVKGQLKRAFQVVRVDTMAAETTASRPDLLPAFQHWKTADWTGRTIAIR